MKIYTKTGDEGETSLFGGKRVWKNDSRLIAYGTVDELNSTIGLAISESIPLELIEVLKSIQNELFTIGSDLATPFDKGNKGFVIPRINEEYVENLEKIIDRFDAKLPELKNFILPGGTKGASIIHMARTVCRRCEREVVALSKIEQINLVVEKYLNRLSDLLFVLARYENFSAGIPDVDWKK